MARHFTLRPASPRCPWKRRPARPWVAAGIGKSLRTEPLTVDRSNIPWIPAGSSAYTVPFVVERFTASLGASESAETLTLPLVLDIESGPETFQASTLPLVECAVTPAETPSIWTDPFVVRACTATPV